ncbi:MAG: ligase-associated DNA damage response endonuclease PdeM [Ferruginibacter sp.]|nr:ligase-associated DNA damage response endonuclease PdeM [Ferruginibacter sp.]
MMDFIKHSILGNSFLLSAGRCIFWEEERTLILSDLHFGKTGHFRKHGIAVPQTIFKEDIQRLTAQVQYFKAKQLIIVGDLFHSHANKEMDLFIRWRNDFAKLGIQLVIGNHDILPAGWYEEAGIDCIKNQLQAGPFIFTHDKAECSSVKDCYIFSGHIHPSVFLHGNAKQSLKFPCFYFTRTYGVLPAFGRFTGSHAISPAKGDQVFVLAQNKVVQL